MPVVPASARRARVLAYSTRLSASGLRQSTRSGPDSSTR